MRVDPVVPRDHLFGDAICAREVGAPDAVCQSVGEGVHVLDDRLLVAELCKIGGGSEDLLAEADIVDGALEQIRLHIETARVAGHFGEPAIEHCGGAFGFALLQIPEHAVLLHFTYQRSHFRRRVQPGANLRLAQHFRDGANELIVDFLVNHPACRGAAHLAAIHRDRAGELRRGGGYIDVVKHHGSAFAAKLEFARDETPSAGFADLAPHLDRSGERHAAHERMIGQCFARLGSLADDDIDDAGRDAGFGRQLRDVEATKRGDFGGFHDDRVARRDGGDDAPHEKGVREVPREDEAAHAVWCAENAGLDVLDRERHAILRVHREFGIVPDALDPERDVEVLRERDRLAHVERLDLRERCAFLLGPLGETVKQGGAFVRRSRGPAGKGLVRGLHGRVDLAGAAQRSGRENAAVGGIDDVPRLAIGAGLPVTADEMRNWRGGEVVGYGFGYFGVHGKSGVAYWSRRRRSGQLGRFCNSQNCVPLVRQLSRCTKLGDCRSLVLEGVVALYSNRRLRSQAIHDLNAVNYCT